MLQGPQPRRRRTIAHRQDTGQFRLQRHPGDIFKAQITALGAGDAWINPGSRCIAIGPPGVGKSHLASAIGRELIENGDRVLMCCTPDLVLEIANRTP